MTLPLFRPRLLLLAALTGCLTACTPTRFRSYYIPSESMQPTLQVHDRILTDRNSYQTQTPERGDVVIFSPPDALIQMVHGSIPINTRTVFVKRIIGLPGEVVEVKQGRVYVNQQPLSETYLLESPSYTWGPVKVAADSFMVQATTAITPSTAIFGGRCRAATCWEKSSGAIGHPTGLEGFSGDQSSSIPPAASRVLSPVSCQQLMQRIDFFRASSAQEQPEF